MLIAILVLIALSAFLVWFLVAHDRGEKEPIGALWIVAGLGLVGAIIAALLEQLLPGKYASVNGAQGVSLGLLLFALSIGLIEESCKFIPSAFYLRKKKFFNEHTDGVIYFALAGLGFGLPENILYTIVFGSHAGFARILLTPFFHSAMTALVGYFFVKVKLDKKPIWIAPLALLGAIIAHGIYDFGLMSGNTLLVIISLLITVSMTVTMFLLYRRARKLDEASGLSVVGNNSYCRSCGFPNPKHQLYCTRCGKRA